MPRASGSCCSPGPSCIGMHRYGGIWTGDNHSWWSHLLLNLKMLPSLNMCGFLYVGADLGGFNADTSRDLLLRWLALGVFTPLMRNHSGSDTRRQEFYQFEGPEDFRSVIETRYRLIPYLYSEYMKAALHNDMMFRPLAFVYPGDEIAVPDRGPADAGRPGDDRPGLHPERHRTDGLSARGDAVLSSSAPRAVSHRKCCPPGPTL